MAVHYVVPNNFHALTCSHVLFILFPGRQETGLKTLVVNFQYLVIQSALYLKQWQSTRLIRQLLWFTSVLPAVHDVTKSRTKSLIIASYT